MNEEFFSLLNFKIIIMIVTYFHKMTRISRKTNCSVSSNIKSTSIYTNTTWNYIAINNSCYVRNMIQGFSQFIQL